MSFQPFDEMQKAVDIVNDSPHPVNKIAATIFGYDRQGRDFSISRTNYWPEIIEARLGMDTDIGDSSGTVHAETACLLDAPVTEKASLCVTDPICPNCAKNIAEAGIKTIYIDHKGFTKDFSARRGNAFSNMSMQICEKAGISVYQLWRKEQRLEPILHTDKTYQPAQDSPLEYERLYGVITRKSFADYVEKMRHRHRGRRFACAIGRDRVSGNVFSLAARSHPVIGYSMANDASLLRDSENKYNYMLEPMNRLIMGAARIGVKLVDGMIFCTNVPTSRELVNLIGAGITRLYIEHANKALDEAAILAKRTVTNARILDFINLEELQALATPIQPHEKPSDT
ncbi:MAG: deoxycytidylate deaminase [Micavibrio aeruginosavorus]|uniref:Deoxycytidylate deaminase n=1 Tax=Micavibrio aeruginosavorus TaxID=349221 RepID=A0A7T5UII5_9BACT|nr:MAG: deoxycytidylate deaminase [Micavibrio aeruginosavorus]